MESYIKKISSRHLIYVLSIIAAVFTWRVMDIRDNWINVDSILYLDSAKAILQWQWQEAYKIYPWPFYSALIALVSKTTGLQVFNAAKILNIIFFTATTFSLAKIIEKIENYFSIIVILVILIVSVGFELSPEELAATGVAAIF